MRRSSAPSQRKKFISPLLGNAINDSNASVVDKYRFIFNEAEKKRSFSGSDTGRLSSAQKLLDSSVSEESSNLFEDSLDIRKFNVVYGKQTKKKHKTWEGDGIIEIHGKNITLRDTDGKIIGQTSNRKIEEVVEGSRILVGSKEVELLDPIENQTQVKKRSLDNALSLSLSANQGSGFNPKRSKCSRGKIPSVFSGPVVPRKSESNVRHATSVEPLVMPRPSEEHQWQYNVSHLPVVDVQVDYCLTKVLRQHQREGVTFLYSCVTGLRSPDHMGAILADEMGLGKTLQCVTLIWTLLNQGFYGGRPVSKRVLVVVPGSLVKNWYNEFIRWIGSFRIKVFAVDKHNKIQNYSKSPFVPVVVISYEMLVKNYDCIKEIDFDLMVCDEGHRLKNSNIQTTCLLSQLPCKRRVLLTGTPLQNDLQEFYTLVNFVNPAVLGSYVDFKKNFGKVIEASREPKAPEDVVALGQEKSRQLTVITNSFILRRTQSVIGWYLPPKYEHVIFCGMSPIQKKLYKILIDYCVQKCDGIFCGSEDFDHLSAITYLKKICNHPSLVGDKFFEPSLLNEVDSVVDSCQGFIASSVKLTLLESLLRSLEKTKERIVLVSNFTQTLDVLEKFCEIKNLKCVRFDGSTPLPLRNSIISNFNSAQSDTGVLLLSSKAGGVGLNVTGASRLVLFDSDWNPATDLQAMARIWRDGQKKTVFIYRFLTSGSIEEKVFQRQLKKAGLNESVVDMSAVSAVKLSEEEIKDLFEFQECENDCLTHDSLDCKCDGNGNVPGIPQELCEDQSRFEDDSDLDRLNGSLTGSVSNEGLGSDGTVEPPCSGGRDESGVDDGHRDCEISFSCDKEVVKAKALRMNQLFLWEHHAAPLSPETLQEIGFDEVIGDKISYIFRNKTI